MSNLDSAAAAGCDPDMEDNRTTAHLAILDVLLIFNRAIQEDIDRLIAVGAVDAGFLNQFQGGLPK